MSKLTDKHIVLGERSRLARTFKETFDDVILLSENDIYNFFERKSNYHGYRIFLHYMPFIKGNENCDELNRHIPLRIFDELHAKVYRFITYGTIYEILSFPDLYTQTKLSLSRDLSTIADNFIHFRMHTLYGIFKNDNMFLSQFIRAVAASENFQMSSGATLRQYHNYSKIARVIADILSGPDFMGIKNLSGEKFISLFELSNYIKSYSKFEMSITYDKKLDTDLVTDFDLGKFGPLDPRLSLDLQDILLFFDKSVEHLRVEDVTCLS